MHPQLPGVNEQDGVHDLIDFECRILGVLESEPLSRAEIALALGMKTSRSGHLADALERLRSLELIELTIPDKPRSRNQKMRITEKGKAWLARSRE